MNVLISSVSISSQVGKNALVRVFQKADKYKQILYRFLNGASMKGVL